MPDMKALESALPIKTIEELEGALVSAGYEMTPIPGDEDMEGPEAIVAIGVEAEPPEGEAPPEEPAEDEEPSKKDKMAALLEERTKDLK